MNSHTMKAYNSAVESIDRRTDYRFDTATSFELLGIGLLRFGWADADVMALRDALREQFQAMVTNIKRA